MVYIYYTMLISFEQIYEILTRNNIHITGAFHVGAHECEELDFYAKLGLNTEQVIWIDAMPNKVKEATDRGIPNVFNAVITDRDGDDVEFNISNNGQSSSVLEFGTHSVEHPWVHYVDKIRATSVIIDTFMNENQIDATKLNFWNFDIQGAELMALKGATQSIQYADAIYLEVNEKELYVNCGLIHEIDAFLLAHGFSRVLTHMTVHGWGDALYIRTQLKHDSPSH